MSETKTVYHSRDDGKTWSACEVSNRSVTAFMLSKVEQWNDGCGNIYRTAPP